MVTNDAYFYMRLVDNMIPNFLNLNKFDPYFIYPDGFSTNGFPYLFAYLLGFAVNLFGGTLPTEHVIDTIAAYISPIIAALTIIPVYFIGRVLINRWAGLIAAVLVAVIPGESLLLSVLGNPDHHSTEVFLISCFSLFFILAIKDARQFTFSMIVKLQWHIVIRNMHFAILSGIFMGLYLATWRGGLVFVFLVFIYTLIQFTYDHLRGLSTDYLSKVLIPCFLTALLVFILLSQIMIVLLSLTFMIIAPLVLNFFSNFMKSRRIEPVYFPVIIVTLGLLVTGAAWLIFPDMFKTATTGFSWLFTWKTDQNYVGEMKPLLFPGGKFTLDVSWYQFGLVLYCGLAGLVFLVYRCIKDSKPEHIFVALWSTVIMLAALAMIRSAIYFAVCLSVLTGWTAGYAIQTLSAKTHSPRKTGIKVNRLSSGHRRTWRTVLKPVLIIIVLMPVVLIAIVSSVNQAQGPFSTPSDAWIEAMNWMKTNTPEPFQDADYYYRLYDKPKKGENYAYPDGFYSVVSWADYGYWITRIGHRVPTSNPSTNPLDEARYFITEDEASARDLLAKWRGKYVIIDNRLTSPNDKFYALANLSGCQEADYYEICWQKHASNYVPLLVFYPEYYRSMMVRLYNFDGKRVVPTICIVMQYEDRIMEDGKKFREIINLKRFRNDSEANVFISSNKQGQYKIISVDPLSSPVSLQGLSDYKLVYASPQSIPIMGSGSLPEIKVFEYVPIVIAPPL